MLDRIYQGEPGYVTETWTAVLRTETWTLYVDPEYVDEVDASGFVGLGHQYARDRVRRLGLGAVAHVESQFGQIVSQGALAARGK